MLEIPALNWLTAARLLHVLQEVFSDHLFTDRMLDAVFHELTLNEKAFQLLLEHGSIAESKNGPIKMYRISQA